MRIVITHRQAQSEPDLAAWLAGRLRLAFSRFAPRVARVTASLREQSDCKAARRYSCRLALRLVSGQRLALESHDDRLYVAVGRAIARMQLQVARQLRGERIGPRMPARGRLHDSTGG